MTAQDAAQYAAQYAAQDTGRAEAHDRSGEGPRRARAGGRRRRANATGERRDQEQKVRLTATEQDLLRRRADALGMTVPRLLVEAGLAGSSGASGAAGEAAGGVETVTERRRLMTELMDAHSTLAGAAVNINQVARKANTTHELPSDFGAALGDVRRLAVKVEQVVDQLIEANRRDGLEVPRR